MDTVTRQELLRRGMTVRQIAASVHRGDLIRVRRGHYALPSMESNAVRAVRVGGRLSCVSELRHRGIWVADDDRLHVQLAPNASRQRRPDDRFVGIRPEDCVRHWRELVRPATASHVSTVDALLCAYRCVERRMFVASVDSALRTGALSSADLACLARALPLAARALLREVDPRADSGLESITRLLCRDLGFRVRSQVRFAAVGRGDLLVEDWIVVETDGDAFHDAKVTTRDRVRDAGFTRHGRTVLHFRYAQVMFDLPGVAATIIAAVASHRRVRNSGRTVARARSRARKLGLS